MVVGFRCFPLCIANEVGNCPVAIFPLAQAGWTFFGGAVSYLLSDRVPLAVVEVINNQHPCSHRAPSGIVLHSFPTVFHVGPHPHRYNPFFKAAFSLLNLRIR
jgi:hypothetical protein